MTRRRRVSRPTERDFEELVGAVYDAALGSVSWADLPSRIATYVGGLRASFAIRYSGSSPLLLLPHNMSPDARTYWSEAYACYDPWIERFAHRKRPGELLHGGSEPFLADMRRTEVYAEAFAPMGVDDLIASTITVRGELHAYFGVYRSRAEGLFEEDDVERARRLTPHLMRASAIQSQLAKVGATLAGAEAVLQCLPHGVLLLDENGALLFANRAAEAQLASGEMLRLRAGVVRARDPALQTWLDTTRAQVLANPGVGAARTSVANGAEDRRLELMLVPVSARSASGPFGFIAGRAQVAVLIADPTVAAAIPADAIAELLELPPSLARLASALSAGATVVEYAEAAGVTEGTARQQLKDLLARTGARRQAELVRILQRSIAALDA